MKSTTYKSKQYLWSKPWCTGTVTHQYAMELGSNPVHFCPYKLIVFRYSLSSWASQKHITFIISSRKYGGRLGTALTSTIICSAHTIPSSIILLQTPVIPNNQKTDCVQCDRKYEICQYLMQTLRQLQTFSTFYFACYTLWITAIHISRFIRISKVTYNCIYHVEDITS